MKTGIALGSAVILVTAEPLFAQSISLSLGDESGSLSSTTLSLFALITILGIAPGIAVMVSCFPFILTVFSILRQAIGLQQAPPNMLIVSLSLFLTYYIMEPVFILSWQNGISPLVDGRVDLMAAWPLIAAPFQDFMIARVNPDILSSFSELRPHANDTQGPRLSTLIPSFMVSEMTRAFQIGFMIFLPFLVIDLVVSAVLMSMGMMMVPPAVVALPFKLAFFAVADGWTLLSTALVRGYIG